MRLLLTMLLMASSLLSKAELDFIVHHREGYFDMISLKKSSYKVKEKITILSPDGDYHADLSFVGSDELDMRYFNIKIRDADGKLFASYSVHDFESLMYFTGSNSYNDKTYYFLDLRQRKYPYTIEYEFEMRMEYLFPMDWKFYNQGSGLLLNSTFTVRSNEDLDYSTFTKGKSKLQVMKKVVDDTNIVVYTMVVDSLDKHERFVNPTSDYLPAVYIAPDKFSRGKYEGSYNSWTEYGDWLLAVWEGRQELPKQAKIEIDQIIASAQNNQEKIARDIYSYVQGRMRYVYLGYGLGGIQTMSAEETYKKGFGDCKALSNFTSTALNYAGIESYVALVSAGPNPTPVYEDFVTDYFNHVIVCIPELNDTTWLECTSQKIPFGYLSDFTDNRKVLLIKPGESKICRTYSYPSELNSISRYTEIRINSEGGASIDSQLQFEHQMLDNNYFYITEIRSDKPEKAVKSETNLKSFTLGNYSCEIYPEGRPEVIAEFNLEARLFVRRAGSKYLFNPFIFSAPYLEFDTTKTRTHPVFIKRGRTCSDVVDLYLPEGFVLDQTEYTESFTISHDFGELRYDVEYLESEDKVRIERKIVVKEGSFDTDDFKQMADLHAQVAHLNTPLFILTKK